MTRNHTVRIGFYTALVLTALFVGGCVNIGSTFKAKAERAEDLTVSAADLASLDVSTNVGTLTLNAAEADDVHISAEITVKAKTEEEAEALVQEVRIVAEPSGQKLVVKAVKPSGFGRNQLVVNFTITAPAPLALQCHTNVGDIRIAGFDDRVTAKTDVGTIHCTDLRHTADLHTNVGDIRAAYAPDAAAAFQASATTNVGNIDFTGPDDISATLEAHVNVGSVDTDRPLTITGKIEKSIRATLGQGEGKISLRTNVGSVKIR